MGKKSKRKAPRAGAGGSASESEGPGNSLVLGPRPDGITCTNEDPNKCAVCFRGIRVGKEKTGLNMCCGTSVCSSCRVVALNSCSFCKATLTSQNMCLGYMKKRAKAGFPWACHSLALLHMSEFPPLVNPSIWVAKSLLERACEKNHPDACFSLGTFYMDGRGCKENLARARELFEKAGRLFETQARLLPVAARRDLAYGQCQLAYRFVVSSEDTDSAKSILLPLANGGNGNAQSLLGAIFGDMGDGFSAWYWYNRSSRNFDWPFHAMTSSVAQRDAPLTRFWYGLLSAEAKECHPSYSNEIQMVKNTRDFLRSVRRACATCGLELTVGNRKLCGGCKATCYCSAECQKAAWDGVHRDECMKVSEFKMKLQEKMKSGWMAEYFVE